MSGIVIGGAILAFTLLFFAPSAETASATSVVKIVDESISGQTVALQDDDELFLTLARNKTYAIDGVIFVQTVREPGGQYTARYSFTASPATSFRMSANSSVDGVMGDSVMTNVIGAEIDYSSGSPKIRAIHVSGTVQTGNQPDEFRFRWGQDDVGVDTATTTVQAGSFLRAEQI